MMNIYYLQSIETPRLLIRPVKLGDEVALNQAIHRSLESLQRWMPWAADPSLQATKDHIDRGIYGWQSGRATELPMTVIHKTDNKIIACSGFNDRSVPVIPVYEIGYWLDVDYRGQGLVTELVNALTRYALEAVGAQRVQMCMHGDNEKSIAVAKRCGFMCELLLKNERRDCVSKQLADSYLFACCDVVSLPPLEVTWQHEEKTLQPLTPTMIQASESPVELPILETQRLTLIPPREQDAPLLHQALLASINEVGPWFSWATSEVTQQQMAVHVAEGMLAAKDVQAYGHLFYLVWDKQQGTLLGEIWCHIKDWTVLHTGIGYWFDSRHTGQGYATEAIARLTQYVFEELNANRVYLDVAADNHSSLKLAKRLGFVHEGTLKHYFRHFVTNQAVDAEMFAVTDLGLQIKKSISVGEIGGL